MHTHARTHALQRTHTHTHAHTQARTHTHILSYKHKPRQQKMLQHATSTLTYFGKIAQSGKFSNRCVGHTAAAVQNQT